MQKLVSFRIRLKIATSKQSLIQLNPIYLLCGNGEETLDHFLLTCDCLDGIRALLVKDIINTCSALFAKNKVDGER